MTDAPLPIAEFRSETAWLRLNIAGYQYPNSTGGHDAEWLMIEGEASLPGQTWTFCDPCLLTFEIERLATWLARVAAGDRSDPLCCFIEPCLQFEINENQLRVIFSHEVAPPGADFDSHSDTRSFGMDIGLHLLQIAVALRRQLARYPVRDYRPGV